MFEHWTQPTYAPASDFGYEHRMLVRDCRSRVAAASWFARASFPRFPGLRNATTTMWLARPGGLPRLWLSY
jgi:hypothetical protein